MPWSSKGSTGVGVLLELLVAFVGYTSGSDCQSAREVRACRFLGFASFLGVLLGLATAKTALVMSAYVNCWGTSGFPVPRAGSRFGLSVADVLSCLKDLSRVSSDFFLVSYVRGCGTCFILNGQA
jgi:hypothetical protein